MFGLTPGLRLVTSFSIDHRYGGCASMLWSLSGRHVSILHSTKLLDLSLGIRLTLVPDDYARASAAKVLMKYRPEALNTEVDQEVVIKTEDVQTEVVPTEAEQPKSWIMRYLDGEIDQSRTAHTPSQALRNLDDS